MRFSLNKLNQLKYLIIFLLLALGVKFVFFRPIFDVSNVSLLDNLNSENSTYSVNLQNAIREGISFPNKNKVGNEFVNYIQFKFEVSNNSKSKLYYKIYYLNTSYKSEYDSTATVDLNNLKESEDFYGSWQDASIGFKEITTNLVVDSFKIIGNPRNEEKYFGVPMDKYFITDSILQKRIAQAKLTPEWMVTIRQKAKENKVPLEEQIKRDAYWVLKDERHKGNTNHRWKRNPRMGNYNIMLVVINEDGLKAIPEEIQFVSKKDSWGYYKNPVKYFERYINSENQNIRVYTNNNLTLKTEIKADNGVYIDSLEFLGLIKPEQLTKQCGTVKERFYNANFEQYFHSVNQHFVLNTIPEVKDVATNEYTFRDYQNAQKKYKESDMKKGIIKNVDCPCINVPQKENYIELRTPGSTDLSTAAKQNVGIKTRHGFTYGKYTAKVKFPELLNNTKVWNGLTNAIWLLFQDKSEWNNRRASNFGYYAKGVMDPNAPRSPQTYYTEIDFEIVKTSKHWPKSYYRKPERRKQAEREQAAENNDIIIATTNWDLANKDPRYFFSEIGYLKHDDKKYEALRWTDLYQALTVRTPYDDDAMFKQDYFYYQIEWKPEEIIWRVGPSLDKLQEVSYMNSKVTNIPNNQMIMVFTQEYHLSEWWPPIPYRQEFIPFPKNDIVGKVYEVTIE